MRRSASWLAGIAALTVAGGAGAFLWTRSNRPTEPTTGITSVEAPRGRVALEDVGSGGIPILFVPEPGRRRETLRPHLELLRAGRRAIAVDLPGSGDSPSPRDGVTTPEALGADLGAVADALSLERFVLACAGEAARPCAALVTAEPWRIAGMLLVDPPPEPAPAPVPEDGGAAPGPTPILAAAILLAERDIPLTVRLTVKRAATWSIPEVGHARPAIERSPGASSLDPSAELAAILDALLVRVDRAELPEQAMDDASFRSLAPFARGAWDEACALRAKAAEASPSNGAAALALARCELRRGNTGPAERAALRAIRHGPEFVRIRAYALLADGIGVHPPSGRGCAEVAPRPELGCGASAWVCGLSLQAGTADPPFWGYERVLFALTAESAREVDEIAASRCETAEDCPLQGLTLVVSKSTGCGVCEGFEEGADRDACQAGCGETFDVHDELLFVDPCRGVVATRAVGESPWSIGEEKLEPFVPGSVPPAEPVPAEP